MPSNGPPREPAVYMPPAAWGYNNSNLLPHGQVGEPLANPMIEREPPIYMPPESWDYNQNPLPHGMVGDDPASRPPEAAPFDPNITGPPGSSMGRDYGSFRKISQRGGPEYQPSNTAELLRKAAARRLGLD